MYLPSTRGSLARLLTVFHDPFELKFFMLVREKKRGANARRLLSPITPIDARVRARQSVNLLQDETPRTKIAIMSNRAGRPILFPAQSQRSKGRPPVWSCRTS